MTDDIKDKAAEALLTEVRLAARRPAFRRRTEELLREELRANNDTPRWFYFSIVYDTGAFAGGCYVKARGLTEAWLLMHNLNLYPEAGGGSVEMLDIPPENQAVAEAEHAAGKSYRLLTKEEVLTVDRE